MSKDLSPTCYKNKNKEKIKERSRKTYDNLTEK